MKSKKRALTWIVATRNSHKVGEIQNILGSDFQYRTLKDFPDAPPVVEDASDFAGNATKKALELATWLATRLDQINEETWVLADDSGLEVDALEGAPGVHSARFAALDLSGVSAAQNSPDAANNAKLLRLLANVPVERRAARFRCVIAITPVLIKIKTVAASPVCYANENELQTELFDGTCEGHIALSPSGSGGFGYDPLFIPSGYTQSFAELGEDVKNRLSHRGQALQKLHRWLQE